MAVLMAHKQHGWMLWQLQALVVLLLVVWPGIELASALNPGRVQFGSAEYTTTEEFGVALVTVQRHLGADGRAAVFVSTRLPGVGGAVVGRDFDGVFNHSLLWEDGDDLDRELYVRVRNDQTPQETAKRFTLFLHDANGASVNPKRVETQVVLKPPTNLRRGQFRFLTPTLVTYESATTLTEIPVLWELGTTATARVAYTIECQTACSPTDFQVVSGNTLEWTRGGPSVQPIQLQILADGVYESAETFVVRLQPPSELSSPETIMPPAFVLPPATLGSITEMQVTIHGPNDVRAGVLQFDAECYPACPSQRYEAQDGGVVRVILQRRNGSDGIASVRIRTVNDDISSDSARASMDYVPVNEVVQWANGDTVDKLILVHTLSAVRYRPTVQFRLVLSDFMGGDAPGGHARETWVTIRGPRGITSGEVSFVAPSVLADVLKVPDLSFLSMATRTESGLRVCPRVVARSPGPVVVLLQRMHGGPSYALSTTVTVQTLAGTAVDGVDYTALPLNTTLVWQDGEMEAIKSVQIDILEPTAFYPGSRSFFVQLGSVTGAKLGDCHLVEIVLDAMSHAPHIKAFALNMDAGTLLVETTDPVVTSTLDASKLILQSYALLAPLLDGSTERMSATDSIEMYRLSGDTTTKSPDGSTSVALTLTTDDLNALKRFSSLAKSAANTSLSAEPGLFAYVYESCASFDKTDCTHPLFMGISISQPLRISSWVPDTTSPMLSSFTMDLGQRLVKLKFSEPVDLATIHISDLSFSTTANAIDPYPLSDASTQVYRPQPNPLAGVIRSDENPLPADATYVTLLLGTSDLAALQQLGNGQIGLAADSTFLAVASTFISDFASPPNALKAIQVTTPGLGQLQRVATSDCSPCPSGTFQTASCSDMKDRVCRVCRVCPTNTYAFAACTALEDTACYPCSECHGGLYVSSECTSTQNRVCTTCTTCTSDEYEATPCARGANRVCRTCDSCTLTLEQKRICQSSFKWKRKQMKAPYACPRTDQRFQTLEARLQRGKSNRCGAGRCSCTGKGVGNANPSGNSFPNDPRCTGPDAYNIFL